MPDLVARFASLALALTFAAGCGDDAHGTTGGAGGTGGSGGTAPTLVTTDHGAVQGTIVGTSRGFFGIPYAAPPTGDRRWKPPAPHDPWADTLQAIAKGPACPQLAPLTNKFDPSTNEDCLTLNVWAPAKPASEKLPVMVWIHGGAFVLGSGVDPSYDGERLSEASGVVVVSINYRLGPLGFLALPELASEDPAHPSAGAYGIEDQRAALAWIKANIEAFGGDPANVTVFGESAGGSSICQHLVSPLSQGLFQHAILESAVCDEVMTKPDGEAQGASLASAVGCSADVLSCLRGKSAADILGALPLSSDFIGAGAKWATVVDGYNLPGLPSALVSAGSFEKMPILLGSNSNEATLFFALGNVTIADDTAFAMFADGVAPGHGAEIVAQYPTASYGSAQAAAVAAFTDAGFTCPARRVARAFAAADQPVFLYHFAYDPKGVLFGDLGAFHSAEIRYVLGNPSQLIPNDLTDEEKPLSAMMMGYWSRFAATASPNGAGALAWPKYDATADQNLLIDLTPSVESGYRKAQCDFWDGLQAP